MLDSLSLAHRCYCFGPFRLDIARQVLYKDEQPVELPRRLVRALQLLVENQGKDLEKDYLMEQLWPARVVEENSLTAIISRLRKVLGEDAAHKKYILTNPGHGYRFVADVVLTTTAESAFQPVPASGTSSRSSGEAVGRFHPQALLTPPVSVVAGLMVLIVLSVLGIHEWSRRTAPQSIAVLPFQGSGAERGDLYLELGMADGLIARLRNVRHVLVRPTTDVVQYQGVAHDPLAVGRALHVESILNGTVRRTGDEVWLTVKLLRMHDGAVVWTHDYHGRLVDILTLQDQIAQETTRALTLHLASAEQHDIRLHYTSSSEAYQAYIAGRYYCHTGSYEQGARYLQQATEKDPSFALAYAGLAGCYLHFAGPPWGDFRSRGSLSPAHYLAQAEIAAQRAVQIDGTLAEAYHLLAQTKAYCDWDSLAAESAFRKSISLAPESPRTYVDLAEFLITQGRFDEAEREAHAALGLDPFFWDANVAISDSHFFAGRYGKAAEEWEKALLTSLSDASWYLAWIYSAQRRPFPMIADLVKAEAAAGDHVPFTAALAYVYALQGMRAEAESRLQTLTQYPDQIDDYQLGLIYVALGDRERAFQLLARARERCSSSLLYLKVDPRLESLRSDPRFNDLARSIHLST